MFGQNHKFTNAKPFARRMPLAGLAAIVFAFGNVHAELPAGTVQADLTVAAPAVGTAPLPSERSNIAAMENTSADQITADAEKPTIEPESTSEVGSTAELQQWVDADDQEDGSNSSDAEPSSPSQGAAADEVRKLSVAPSTQTLLPEDHPAWIAMEPDFTSATHRFAVGSIPTSNLDDCDEALDEPLLAAVYGYIDEQIVGERNASGELRSEIDVDYIRRNLVDEPDGYVAELSTSEGPMYQKWLSVSVTPEQQSQLKTWYDEAIQRRRLGPIALGLLSLLTFVGVTHLALRRRHGLPRLQSLRGEDADLAQADVKRRSGGRSVVAIMLFLVGLPIAVIFSLMIVSRAAMRNAADAEYTRYTRVVETRPGQVSVQPLVEEGRHKLQHVADGRSQSVIRSTELPDGRVEVKLNTGGQQIILRRSSP